MDLAVLRQGIAATVRLLRDQRAALDAAEGRPSAIQLRVLAILSRGPATVQQVSRALGPCQLRRPTLCRARPHLAALTERGLVEFAGYDGRHALHCITAAGIATLGANEGQADGLT